MSYFDFIIPIGQVVKQKEFSSKHFFKLAAVTEIHHNCRVKFPFSCGVAMFTVAAFKW